MQKFNIIYIDVPWKFKNQNTGGSMSSGSANQYPVLSIDQLKTLPIDKISSNDSVLFMWHLASMPLEALDLVFSWGFELKTMTGFTWVKLTKNEKLHFGMGHWSRMGSESMLIATKGKPKRASASVRAVELVEFEEETIAAKVEEHSVKPDIFRTRIVELMGDVSRIELFANKKVQGWESLGYGVDGQNIFESIKQFI